MYTNDLYKVPFWAENSGFMTGRDPLGIQNSSITVYGRLLPGMTNLTLRLRYYGLYCWLINEYDKLPGNLEKKSLQHQYNFIRRAELTIAFIMINLDSSQLSIIGSDFSTKNLNEINTEGYYDIGKGADKTKETIKGSVYWDFPSGALGQYYAGSLINLDLIEVIDKFFHIRPNGLELSKAFEKSINPHAQSLFLRVLEEGILTLDDIYNLDEFLISRIIKENDEWLFYNSILFADDGEKLKTSDGKISSQRKDTIKLYLEYLPDKSKGLTFQAEQYKFIESGDLQNEASLGWYYYFINEAIHYCVESIFWAMLVELDGKNIPVQQYINQIVEIILDQTNSNFGFDKDQTLLEIISTINSTNLIVELQKLENFTKSPHNSKEALGFSIKLILQIFVNIERKLILISDFEKRNYLGFQKGIINEYVQIFVTDSLDDEFHHYLIKMVKYIINDHISTAYRKMGNGESNLLKFLIEDGNIGHIQTMLPKVTNPRLKTLHNFLVDLGYIDNNSELTEDGVELLTQFS